ncbi:hypothetical protein DAETH_38470 (plasmid) [Deinococcus aetherius]|uniref:Uncharacterized protein n=1 Tax=Deinococcus aetherius TaxID=200252 RepID=A0ABN6RM93_9DEIO|nr:SBBP repeat-containing protein [Deinococcus aetherius]BDP43878.1 hypothetical protein DAETH_38470 [Deinococcus aetherius]
MLKHPACTLSLAGLLAASGTATPSPETSANSASPVSATTLVPFGTRQFGTDQDDTALGIARDLRGNVYVVGYNGAGLDGQPAPGGLDAFLVSYDAGGVSAGALWGVTVGGTTTGGLDGQVSQGGQDAFVKKFDVFGGAR